jgi:MFS family permease
MVQAIKNYLRFLFPDLHSQIWVLAIGRFLSLIGTDSLFFTLPFFFKHSVGLTAAAVGLGLGLSQVPGIVGRILGGTLSDGPLMAGGALSCSLPCSASSDRSCCAGNRVQVILTGNPD